MPQPKKKQSLDKWMSSCMGSNEMQKSFPNQKQRLAVCYSKYRKKHGKKSAPKK